MDAQKLAAWERAVLEQLGQPDVNWQKPGRRRQRGVCATVVIELADLPCCGRRELAALAVVRDRQFSSCPPADPNQPPAKAGVRVFRDSGQCVCRQCGATLGFVRRKQ